MRRAAAGVIVAERDDQLSRFWIGRNPRSTRLPYLLRLPVTGEGRVFLAARETWPRGKDVFCQQVEEWPAEAEILEEIPVEACWRSGAAVHLVLRRRLARRSLFVWTQVRGRPAVFWRSQTSMRGARPGIRVPQARALEGPLRIAIDVAERYAWRFARHSPEIERRGLPVGDYAVLRDGAVVAAVERKAVADLATAAIAGQLSLVLGDLGQVPRAALVVEGRLSDAVKAARRGAVRAGWLLNVIAALQAAHPRVMWMFAETRSLAEDWAYRWLAACLAAERAAAGAGPREARAIGEPALQYELPLGPRVLDAGARRGLLLKEAEGGARLSAREAAARCGVSPATAANDLRALVASGLLRAEGSGRGRRYRAVKPGLAPPPSGTR